jgi:hypothetical protein
MADLSDIESALAARVDAALYPNGDAAASAVRSPVIIGRGWPADADLKKNLRATPPAATVSIVPLANI